MVPEAVAERLPPTEEAAKTIPLELVMEALPVPAVCTSMVPPTVRVPPRVMFWFTATVVKLALPVTATVTAPWVMVPVVAVAERLPPTEEAAKTIPLELVMVALPVPAVCTSMVPPTVRVPPRVMFWFSATVVKLALPVTATVTAPWVMVPVVAVAERLPPTEEAAKTIPLELVMVALPVPAVCTSMVPTARVPRVVAVAVRL